MQRDGGRRFIQFLSHLAFHKKYICIPSVRYSSVCNLLHL